MVGNIFPNQVEKRAANGALDHVFVEFFIKFVFVLKSLNQIPNQI